MTISNLNGVHTNTPIISPLNSKLSKINEINNCIKEALNNENHTNSTIQEFNTIRKNDYYLDNYLMHNIEDLVYYVWYFEDDFKDCIDTTKFNYDDAILCYYILCFFNSFTKQELYELYTEDFEYKSRFPETFNAVYDRVKELWNNGGI